MVTAQEALGGMWDNWTRRGRRGAAGGQGGAASAAETQKYDKVQTWGPHHTDKGGQRVPQLRSCWNVPKTAILARGPAPVQRTPALPRSPHIELADNVIVREPGKLHKAVAEQLDRPRPAQACGCCPPKSPGCSFVAPHH